MKNLPITIFSIQGNHDKRPERISSYKTKEFLGGTVFVEDKYDNLLFAKDGEIYQFGKHNCLVLGGAFSVDRYYRLFSYLYYNSLNINDFDKALDVKRLMIKANPTKEDKDYLNGLATKFQDYICCWDDEEMSDETKNKILNTLEGQAFDCVFSHTCPINFMPTECFLSSVNRNLVDNKTEMFLQDIYDKYKDQIKMWFCGHFHTTKKVNIIHFKYRTIEEFK